jgi:hypothetical protein
MHAELGVDALEVHLHGVAADAQRRGDRRDAQPLGHQGHDLHFPPGQGRQVAAGFALAPRVVQRDAGSTVHLRDDAHEIAGRGILDHEPRHAGVDRSVNGVGLAAGIHHDPRARIDPANLTHGLQAVRASGMQAHHGHVRPLGEEALDRALHRSRLRDHAHARVPLEDRDHAFTDQVVIVDAQQRDSRARHRANYEKPADRDAKPELSPIVSAPAARQPRGRTPPAWPGPRRRPA